MKLISRDWTEDFKYENGMYGNKCVKCGQEFIGYKRRLICKICATSKAVALKRWLCALHNLPIKLLIKYHLWRSSKLRIAPKGYTEKQADDIWWKHNSKAESLIEKLKRT